MNKKNDDNTIEKLNSKLKTNLEITRAKSEKRNAIQNYKDQILKSKEKNKELIKKLRKEENDLKSKKQNDSRYKKEIEIVERDLKESILLLKKQKVKNKDKIKLAKEENKKQKLEFKLKHSKKLKEISSKINEEIDLLKKEQTKWLNSQKQEIIKISKEMTNKKIDMKNELSQEKFKLIKFADEIKLKNTKLIELEDLKEEEEIMNKKLNIQKNKNFQKEKQLEIKLMKEQHFYDKEKIKKESFSEIQRQKKEIEIFEKNNFIKEKKESIENKRKLIEKIKEENNLKKKNYKLYGPFVKFHHNNVYIKNNNQKYFLKLINKKNLPIDNFSRTKNIYNELLLYNSLIKKENPINIKYLIRDTFIFGNESFSKEQIEEMYERQFLSLVSGYFLDFKNWYIEFKKNKTKKFNAINFVENRKYSPFEKEELKNFYIELVNSKLEKGSIIELFSGIIFYKENNNIFILESSKFKG